MKNKICTNLGKIFLIFALFILLLPVFKGRMDLVLGSWCSFFSLMVVSILFLLMGVSSDDDNLLPP